MVEHALKDEEGEPTAGCKGPSALVQEEGMPVVGGGGVGDSERGLNSWRRHRRLGEEVLATGEDVRAGGGCSCFPFFLLFSFQTLGSSSMLMERFIISLALE